MISFANVNGSTQNLQTRLTQISKAVRIALGEQGIGFLGGMESGIRSMLLYEQMGGAPNVYPCDQSTPGLAWWPVLGRWSYTCRQPVSCRHRLSQAWPCRVS